MVLQPKKHKMFFPYPGNVGITFPFIYVCIYISILFIYLVFVNYLFWGEGGGGVGILKQILVTTSGPGATGLDVLGAQMRRELWGPSPVYARSPKLGMFPFILTVLNGDDIRGYYNP